MLQENRQAIEHNGEQVFFSVSPCSWMYPRYGLQVGISLTQDGVNAETEFVLDKGFDAIDKPMQHLNEAARTMVEKWLAENGTAPLHDLRAKWQAAKAQFAVEIEKDEKRTAAAREREDKRYKAKGYTHRIDAVIHPAHGDDHLSVSYVAGIPTEEDIARILFSSVVKSDYVVTEL